MDILIQSKEEIPKVYNSVDSIFSTEYNPSLIHQCVISYLSNARVGSKAQKSRADVTGGKKKPWKQKGTGRARAGVTVGPLWRGGGVTFASGKQNYTKKINKKMYKKAMNVIFSELLRTGRLFVIDNFSLITPKTKEFISKISFLDKAKENLLIVQEVTSNLYLASRNVPNFNVIEYSDVNPVSLVHADKVFITSDGMSKLEGLFV